MNEQPDKQMSELKEEKEKADKTSKAMMHFIASMNHEIRTPVNGIIGITQLLKASDNLSQEQLAFAKIIENAAFGILNSWEENTDFLSLTSGWTEVFITETKLTGFLGQLHFRFMYECEIKAIRLNLKNSLNSPERIIMTDSILLAKVFTLLINNAIKYASQGTVEFGVSPGCEPSHNPDELEFYVKDSGPGIPEPIRERIRACFNQTDPGFSGPCFMAGMSMSLAKVFIDMLNGKIRMESEDGKGAAFYFTIPVNGKPDEDQHKNNKT